MPISSILDEVLIHQPCAPAQASHFVLCNGARMRYLISLRGGTRHLVRCVAAYGGKLALLLRLLPYLPFRLLCTAHLGFYTKADLHPEVSTALPADCHWNMLIGTYDSKQKLVLQCFTPESEDSTFVKVGNEATEQEMRTEISLFRDIAPIGKLMEIPRFTGGVLREEGCTFNLMMTKEFHGSKVPAELTADICELWREIADLRREEKEGVIYEFSHGDFTPWNLRHTGVRYIVFDWEHCGMKPYGYDLVYYCVVLRLACRAMRFDEAFDESLLDIRRFIPDFTMDKSLFFNLFTDVITPDGF